MVTATLMGSVGGVFAADTAYSGPTAAASPDGWTNPTNVFADDDAFASAGGDDVDQGYRGFGLAVPAGSIVDGITVQVDARSTAADGCAISVRLSGDDGDSWTARKTADLSDAFQVLTFGSSSDDWGRVWDPVQLADAAFRLELRNEAPAGSCPGTTDVDSISLSIAYRTIKAGTANAPIAAEVCESADFNFAIDMSGSIGEESGVPSNLEQLKDGVAAFVNAFEGAGGHGRYAGSRFSGSTASELTAGYVSATDFLTVVYNLDDPSGLTPTAAGINTARANNANDRSGAPNILFVVTDGSPNKPNTTGDVLANPAMWLQGADPAIEAANAARAGSGADKFAVKAVYLSAEGDPGDQGLPFSPLGDAAWAQAVMNAIGGGSHLSGDFSGFVDELFQAIGCPPPPDPTPTATATPTAEPTPSPSAEPTPRPTPSSSGGVLAETATPAVTLPPTDSAGAVSGGRDSSIALAVLGLLATSAVALTITPRKGRRYVRR